MLHHVTLEIAPEGMERTLTFWSLLDFKQVSPPDDLAADFVWFEREGTQIHLMRVANPTVPSLGHPAVVVPDLEATLERLREAGFETSPKRERWGAARAEAIAPGGHRVELMSAPPATA